MVRHLETAVLYDSADNLDLPYRVRTTTSPLLGGSRNDVTV